MRDETRAGTAACPPNFVHRYRPQLIADGRCLPYEVRNAGAESRTRITGIDRPDEVVVFRAKAVAKQSSRKQGLSVHERRLHSQCDRAAPPRLSFAPSGDGPDLVRKHVHAAERVQRIAQHLCTGRVAGDRCRRGATDEKATRHTRSRAGIMEFTAAAY